jgi:hypothetical protein
MAKPDFGKAFNNIVKYLHNNIQNINNSKLFAGLMIITLNIASKFVTIKLSKTMESYLKYTFSRQILIFAIAWMGTRDIYIALIVSTVFVICMDYFFNEDSPFCVLPESFTDYHVAKLDNPPEEEGSNTSLPSDEEIKKAKEVLERAKNQSQQQSMSTMSSYK